MILLAIHWQYMMEQDGITGSKATMNFKDIHIGQMIEMLVTESGIELSRICNFMKSTEDEIKEMYKEVLNGVTDNMFRRIYPEDVDSDLIETFKEKYTIKINCKKAKEEKVRTNFAKIIDNNLFIIYKNGSSLLEHIDNYNYYLDLFEKKKCTKKEFKNAFDEAIKFYKKLV